MRTRILDCILVISLILALSWAVKADERTDDIKARLQALEYRKIAGHRALDVGNIGAWLRDSIKTMDHAEMETKISLIETKHAEYLIEVEAENTRDADIQSAKDFIKAYDCSSIASSILKALCIKG